MVRTPFLVVSAISAFVSAASSQTLVKDIRAQPPSSGSSSYMLELADLGSSTVLFGTHEAVRGSQIWRTNGSAAGTVPVTAFSTESQLQFQLSTMRARNGVLVFPCGEEGDMEVWRTDGTSAGTHRIADVRPGPMGSMPRYFTPVGNLVFFTADDGVHGEELWRTDGTAAGTFMVVDLEVGSLPHVFELAEFNGRLVFRGTLGGDLWSSDGTPGGTFRIKDIHPSGAAWVSDTTIWNGAIWFSAFDGSNGYELWRSDGTTAGTTLFADIVPGAGSSYPHDLCAAGPQLFFAADNGNAGTELWATDGTVAGTRLVRDIMPGSGPSNPAKLTAFGNRVIFAASDVNGLEPWISDGTSGNTFLLADLAPGNGGSEPNAFRVFANGTRCAFRGITGATGREPFVTDGTQVGTRLLADVRPGPSGSLEVATNFSFGVVQGSIVFPADDGTHGIEPWISDGTQAGTRLLADTAMGIAPGSNPLPRGELGDRVFFAAHDGTSVSFWSSDGTSAGTIAAGFPGTTPLSDLVEYRGRHYFVAFGAFGGLDLWATDGTLAGTGLVQNVPGSALATLLVANDRLFLLSGTQLWVSDGTAAGTSAVKVFQPRPLFGLPPKLFCEFQGAAILVAEDLGAVELWRSDGTAAGTFALTNFGRITTVDHVRSTGARLLLTATDVASGTELWSSDGTSAGTGLFVDMVPGPGSSFPEEITVVAGGAFFACRNALSQKEICFTDGTVAGTRSLKALASSSLPIGLTAFGAKALFVDVDGVGREPWISDGTSVGTLRIGDLRAGPKDSMVQPSSTPAFTVLGSGRVALFSAFDDAHGWETWRTDGTSQGSWRVTEIGPAQISSNPRSWRRLGGKVLFAATEPATGEELHGISLASTGDSLAAPRVRGCAGTAGVPRLSPQGLPTIGNAAFGLQLTSARPNAVAWFSFGFANRVPLGACTLGTTEVLGVTLATTASGAAALPVPVPNDPALFGGELVVQALVIDPQGAFQNLLAFSNDLFLVVAN